MLLDKRGVEEGRAPCQAVWLFSSYLHVPRQ
jgi:hypothetical protein